MAIKDISKSFAIEINSVINDVLEGSKSPDKNARRNPSSSASLYILTKSFLKLIPEGGSVELNNAVASLNICKRNSEAGKCGEMFIKTMKLQDEIMQLELKEKQELDESKYVYLSVEEIHALPQLKQETLLLLRGPPQTTAIISPELSETK